MAMNRAKERLEERKQQQRRNQIALIVGIVVVAVIVVAGLVLVSSAPTDAPIADETLARYDGIQTSNDDNGFPLLGKSNAKVQVVAYLAFTSTESLTFYKDVYPSLLERVKKGEISYVVAPIRNASGGNPDGAARTALCAGEQGKFWEAHDTLFQWAEKFGSSAFSTNRIRQGMTALGVVSDTFNSCFNSSSIQDKLFKAQQGISTTPTVKVNGATVEANLEAINTAIDSFAPFDRAEATAEATESLEATPESTSEATAEATAIVEVTAESVVEQTAEVTQEPTATKVPPTATTQPTEVPPTATQVKPTATNTPKPTDVPPTATAITPSATPTPKKPTATATTQPTAEATAEATQAN